MNYTDNPSRPRMHFWFGPLTMLGFIDWYGWQSGTIHQAQCWQLKAAVNSALDDIRNNHPNDNCSLSHFATTPYQVPRVPMGQDWGALRLSLYYPNFRPGQPHGDFINLLKAGDTTTELRPYNSSLGSTLVANLPNPSGATDPVSGLAMAFNTLSWSTSASNATTPVGSQNGGTGRRGAAKIVIFETDGLPNSTQNWGYTNGGTANAYYRFGGTLEGSGPEGTALAVVNRMRQQQGAGGMSLPNAPCRVFAIGFGDVFTPPLSSSATSALAFLLNVQKAGGTSAPYETALPPEHIITGPYQTRIDNLRTALERIMQSGVQVTLIQ
jgi:hypothetical protein